MGAGYLQARILAGQEIQLLAIGAGVQVQEATANDRREQLDRAVVAAYRDRDRDIWASLADFDEVAKVEFSPKMEGRQMIMILAPR